MIDEKELLKVLNKWSDFLGKKTDGRSILKWVTLLRVRALVIHFPKANDWIPCSVRLPEERINPVTNDFYEYQVTYRSDDVTDIRHYKFGRGHWWNGPGTMDKCVTAWKPLPEPYKA